MTRSLGLAFFACFAALGQAACSDPHVSLGNSYARDAGSETIDDDDASPGERQDDFDDVTPSPGSHECLEYEPVCGSDGKTYDNRCDASTAGVQIKAQGPCL